MASFFARETTEAGDVFPTDVVSKHLIFLLLAAHDTTTAALTMACCYLAENKQWQERIREEVRTIIAAKGGEDAGGNRIAFDDLVTMEDTGNVFKEVERLHPSVPAFMRRTVKETEIGGYPIAAHTPIQVSPIYTHRMEEPGHAWLSHLVRCQLSQPESMNGLVHLPIRPKKRGQEPTGCNK